MDARMAHYDGSDVIVLNDCGCQLRDVDEVCIEFDRALVHVHVPRDRAAAPPLYAAEGYAIFSARDGRRVFSGAARVVGV